MAETLISPGVLARENDNTFIQQQPVDAGAAIIGPAVKGPVEIPTLVTSYTDYQNRFGTTFDSGSDEYTYFTSIAAYNYFQNGGDSLLVTRVVSASSNWTYATASVENHNGDTAFTLEAIDKGDIFNNLSTILSNNSLTDGTRDNIRWEIAASSSANGVFDLVIRRGDDNENSKTILETFTDLSLDPKSDRYISKIVGDQTLKYNATENYIEVSGSYPNASRYVRVKSVDNPTLNYFDNAGNAKTAFVDYIPVQGSGSWGGSFSTGVGSNIPSTKGLYYDEINTNAVGTAQSQGVIEDDYTDMLNLLANVDDYQYNIMLIPGLTNVSQTSPLTTAINNAQTRGDHLVVIDPVNYAAQIGGASGVKAQANSRDTSYGAMYWPWVRTKDPDSGKNVWVPASTMMGGVFAFNDRAAEPWFAPAGINRGGLGTVLSAERKLSATNRDDLYSANINPIATFPGVGTVVYGQKTLQRKASALDRVNVRRLLIELKGYISQVAQNLVFEQNTAATRNNFLAQVNPYLENVQARQGLYAFKVIMDDSNNTPDVIDRNQLVGQIYIQPTRTAEFIYLDFNLQPTGATFPA